MSEEESFETLLARIREGDADAARDCVRLYEAEIRRAARVRLTDPHLRRIVDSVDICQSVFGKFFRNAAAGRLDLESPQQLLALLVTMTRNRVIDEHRRQNAQKRRASDEPVVALDESAVGTGDDGPRTVAILREMIGEIRARLSAEELLIADGRNAGRSWQEIADELGHAPDAVRKRLARAVERVRAEIGG